MTKALTKTQPEILPPATDTETLLQGLIIELHQIIRDQVRPAINACDEGVEQRQFVHSAVSLTQIAATVGDTIARLRSGGTTEARQRITVERIQRVSNDRWEPAGQCQREKAFHRPVHPAAAHPGAAPPRAGDGRADPMKSNMRTMLPK